jgi:RND family efflux transporter MFP subunit
MSADSVEPKAKPVVRWLWIAGAAMILIGVILVLLEVEDTVDVEKSSLPPRPPAVSVLMVDQATVRAEITAFAEVRPRWDAELRSAVTGRIVAVHESALAGSKVAKGDPLFTIEKAQYESAVASAEMEVEEAQLALLRAQNDVTVARRQFERDGIDPPTELSLRLPQLRIQEKTVASAQSKLEAARKEFSDTEVTAPFSGFVIRRAASLGQTVAPGEALLHLSDDRQFEPVAEFSQADWKLLEHPISGKLAALYDRDGAAVGQAQIRRGGGFLDQNTRQMRVFLEVTEPNDQILAGDYLRVSIPGRLIDETLTLPDSAVTRAGYVWLVDADDLLRRITPSILFRSDGTVTIPAPAGGGPWRVARTPLASFLPGQHVKPLEVEG